MQAGVVTDSSSCKHPMLVCVLQPCLRVNDSIRVNIDDERKQQQEWLFVQIKFHAV